MKQEMEKIESTQEGSIKEELILEALEKKLDNLNERVKKLTKKNGFSRVLRERVEVELG